MHSSGTPCLCGDGSADPRPIRGPINRQPRKRRTRELGRFSGAAPHDRVFVGEKGGPVRELLWEGHWKRARAEVGLVAGFRFHDLRHTANTLTAATGASTRELMHRLGHASPAAALRYQHATHERDAAIAEALNEVVARAAPEVAAEESAHVVRLASGTRVARRRS
jgi:integrase